MKSLVIKADNASPHSGQAFFSTVMTGDMSVVYDKHMLEMDVKTGDLLGEKGAGKQLYLYRSQTLSSVLLEIGRLRELTFRKLGLGSGKRYDLDAYDYYYEHLILWDDQEKLVIGSYRLLPFAKGLEDGQTAWPYPLYTQTIFDYGDHFFTQYAEKTVEMGRIFVRPSYWGTNSLDYLWFGMGYYFARRTELNHFLCALSIPPAFQQEDKAVMVDFFRRQFPDKDGLALARYPYHAPACNNFVAMTGTDSERFRALSRYLRGKGLRIPMLYRNTAVFASEGARFIDFGYDKAFSNAFDGLFLANIDYIQDAMLNRYQV